MKRSKMDDQIFEELIGACEARMGASFKKAPKEDSDADSDAPEAEESSEDDTDDETTEKLLALYRDMKD
jgi:hypothetical protein